MAAEENIITTEDLQWARTADFAYKFNSGVANLAELLGTTRKIAVKEGTTLKARTVTGTLASGAVTEGDIIPLSKYATEDEPIGEAKLNTWRNATTAAAILRAGRDQAIVATTDAMLLDIQKDIRKNLFAFLKTGTGSATGATLQEALAHGWGQMQVLWEDDAVETVFFLNPLDVADFLAKASITTQNAFGMKYIKDFLGLGTVILSSNVTKGEFYATAKGNVVMYYIDMADGDIAQTFSLTTDSTGYIGIREYLAENRANVEHLIMSGVSFFPERLGGIVKGTIGGE